MELHLVSQSTSGRHVLVDAQALTSGTRQEESFDQGRLDLEIAEGRFLLCTTPSRTLHMFLNLIDKPDVPMFKRRIRQTLLYAPSGKVSTAALEGGGTPSSFRLSSLAAQSAQIPSGWYQVFAEEINPREWEEFGKVLEAKMTPAERRFYRTLEASWTPVLVLIFAVLFFTIACAMAPAWDWFWLSLLGLFGIPLLVAVIGLLPPVRKVYRRRSSIMEEWLSGDREVRLHLLRKDREPWMYGIELTISPHVVETISMHAVSMDKIEEPTASSSSRR